MGRPTVEHYKPMAIQRWSTLAVDPSQCLDFYPHALATAFVPMRVLQAINAFLMATSLTYNSQSASHETLSLANYISPVT